MNATADNIPTVTAFPRAENGYFAKGNPGRPKGAVGKRSRAALERVKSFGPDALEALHTAILARERWAVEYCLNKILPTNSRSIEWEGVSVDDAAAALKAGDISISEFREMLTGVAKMMEIAELEDIKSKLVELEKLVNAK